MDYCHPVCNALPRWTIDAEATQTTSCGRHLAATLRALHEAHGISDFRIRPYAGAIDKPKPKEVPTNGNRTR